VPATAVPATAVPEAAASPAAAAGTAVPVSSTAAAPPAPSQEESLNLVSLVGPAVAKRAVPVIVTAVIVLLSVRAVRRRQRRDGEA
jgi:hypothetical protein